MKAITAGAINSRLKWDHSAAIAEHLCAQRGGGGGTIFIKNVTHAL